MTHNKMKATGKDSFIFDMADTVVCDTACRSCPSTWTHSRHQLTKRSHLCRMFKMTRRHTLRLSIMQMLQRHNLCVPMIWMLKYVTTCVSQRNSRHDVITCLCQWCKIKVNMSNWSSCAVSYCCDSTLALRRTLMQFLLIIQPYRLWML